MMPSIRISISFSSTNWEMNCLRKQTYLARIKLQSLAQHEQPHLSQVTVHDHRVSPTRAVTLSRSFENAAEALGFRLVRLYVNP